MSTSGDSPLTPPPGRATFPLLDGLRGVAALLVLTYHWIYVTHVGGPVGAVLSHGNAGVAVFFLLSGFLIYRPFVVARDRGRPVSLRTFYLRRAARVVPAYWFALSLAACLFGLTAFRERWWQLYLFGQIYTPSLVFTGGLGPAWSLCIEVSFYLLIPFYALLVRHLLPTTPPRRAVAYEAATLGCLALGSLVVHWAAGRYPLIAAASFTLPGTFYLFAVGMAAAVVSAKTGFFERLRLRSLTASWILGVALFVALSFTIDAESLGSVNPLYIPTAVLVLLPAFASRGTNRAGAYGRLLTWRPLAALGVVSYAFYLWHQVLMVELAARIKEPAVLLVAAVAVTTLVATISYVLIERPVLRLVRHRATARARVTARSTAESPRPLRTGSRRRSRA